MKYLSRGEHALTPEQWQSKARAIQAKIAGLSLDELLSGRRADGSSYLINGSSDRHGYDANQPRVPAGHPDGGQWTSGGRGSMGRSLEAFVDIGGEGDDEFLDAIQPRARLVAARVMADYTKAFTGISRIDKNTRALGEILEGTMQTMSFIPTWTPQVYGTAVHVAFGTAVRFAGLEGIGPRDVEHSFVNGGSADYGEPGSIRTDVVMRNEEGTVIAIYDLKTGNAILTPARVRELRRKTGAGPNVPIIELRVGSARLTRHYGTDDVIRTITAQLGNQSSLSSWNRGASS